MRCVYSILLYYSTLMLTRLLLILLTCCAQYGINAQVMINEICPANADVNYDPKYFNFSGWVELYNKGNSSVNIGGYYLSDKPDRPEKWRIPTGTTIPAKGFMLIWCDDQNENLHTNFSLDSEGESVILSTSNLSKVDQIDFPEQYTNIAYGRTTDGGST